MKHMFNGLRRFYDNFCERSKDLLSKTERAFNQTVEKIETLVKSAKARFSTPVAESDKGSFIPEIGGLVSSILGLIIDIFTGKFDSDFFDVTREFERVTEKNFLDGFGENAFGDGVWFLALGLSQLRNVMHWTPSRVFVVFGEAMRVKSFMKNKGVEEIENKFSLPEHESKAAAFIFFASSFNF